MSPETIRRVRWRRSLPVLRGLLLALPVLSVFTCLLASADLVFARYVLGLLRFDLVLSLQEFFWRSAIVLMVAWLAAGALTFSLIRGSRPDAPEPWEGVITPLSRILSLGFVEVVTLLVCVDLLFLVFGWIQFTYLFGGYANIGHEGYTYADYARRGFFELVVVAVLSLGLILGLHSLAWRETRGQRGIFNGLGTLMVTLVMVLLASAFWRMLLYEEAYGYTHLRLYVHFFEVWLAVTFGWMLVTLWCPRARFGIGALLAILGFVATINIANPDALIAEQNLRRWELTRNLDISYLTGLSEDAVPALVPYVEKLDASNQYALRSALNQQLLRMESNSQWREWPSFNVARWEAYSLLRSALAKSDPRIPSAQFEGSTDGMTLEKP
jgi:hypothetical protein